VFTKAMIAALIGSDRECQRWTSRAKSGCFAVKSAKQDAKTLPQASGAASDNDGRLELAFATAGACCWF
jgi:hypothetical protein